MKALNELIAVKVDADMRRAVERKAEEELLTKSAFLRRVIHSAVKREEAENDHR